MNTAQRVIGSKADQQRATITKPVYVAGLVVIVALIVMAIIRRHKK